MTVGGSTISIVAAATVIVLKWFGIHVQQEELVVVLGALAVMGASIVTIYGRYRVGDLHLFKKPESGE